MGPWIQDALDLIEFANGDTTTTWGKVLAGMGHPGPFNLKYLCLGNEEEDIPEFRAQFVMMADSVSDHARIFFDNSLQEEFTLCLYDFSGRQIFHKAGIRENNTEINQGSLPSGTYLLELKTTGKLYREKMIILPN